MPGALTYDLLGLALAAGGVLIGGWWLFFRRGPVLGGVVRFIRDLALVPAMWREAVREERQRRYDQRPDIFGPPPADVPRPETTLTSQEASAA